MTIKSIEFVWDLPTRVFHWLLVATFLVVQISAEWSESLHEIFGYAVLCLMGFRVIYGILGPTESRLSRLIPTRRELRQYSQSFFQNQAHQVAGHNPFGGIMVACLLATLIMGGVTGHLGRTDLFWGMEWIEELHEVLGELSMMLVIIHITAVIAMSLINRRNIVRRMLGKL